MESTKFFEQKLDKILKNNFWIYMLAKHKKLYQFTL